MSPIVHEKDEEVWVALSVCAGTSAGTAALAFAGLALRPVVIAIVMAIGMEKSSEEDSSRVLPSLIDLMRPQLPLIFV